MVDPDRILERIQELYIDMQNAQARDDDWVDWAEELAEEVQSLHQWIKGGGVLPRLWQQQGALCEAKLDGRGRPDPLGGPQCSGRVCPNCGRCRNHMGRE